MSNLPCKPNEFDSKNKRFFSFNVGFQSKTPKRAIQQIKRPNPIKVMHMCRYEWLKLNLALKLWLTLTTLQRQMKNAKVNAHSCTNTRLDYERETDLQTYTVFFCSKNTNTSWIQDFSSAQNIHNCNEINFKETSNRQTIIILHTLF